MLCALQSYPQETALFSWHRDCCPLIRLADWMSLNFFGPVVRMLLAAARVRGEGQCDGWPHPGWWWAAVGTVQATAHADLSLNEEVRQTAMQLQPQLVLMRRRH